LLAIPLISERFRPSEVPPGDSPFSRAVSQRPTDYRELDYAKYWARSLLITTPPLSVLTPTASLEGLLSPRRAPVMSGAPRVAVLHGLRKRPCTSWIEEKYSRDPPQWATRKSAQIINRVRRACSVDVEKSNWSKST
jgi:hypothetical protein